MANSTFIKINEGKMMFTNWYRMLPGAVFIAIITMTLLFVSCNDNPSNPVTGPVISLSTQQIFFYAVGGGNNPSRQAILIRNTGTGTLNCTATATSDWLDLRTVDGTDADTVFIYAYISGHATGVYLDTITITSSGALNSPQKIAVTLTIQPDFIVLPASLQFNGLVDGPPPADISLIITSTGTSGITYTAVKTTSWLTISKTSGATPDTMVVSIQSTGMTAGTYLDSIVMTTTSPVNPRVVIPVTLLMTSWKSYLISGSNDLRGVHVIDDSIALAVGFIGNVTGHSGVILKTVDAGLTWDAKKYVDHTSLGGIHFADKLHGWAAGDSAVILRTNDGGETWKQLNKDSLPIADSISLWRVRFADEMHGWIVGVKGVLLRTIDAGASWSLETTGSGFSLADIEVRSATNAFIVGNHGTILHTGDGEHWNPQTSGTISDLWAISMYDDLNGWVAGSNGHLLYTSDGGENWLTRTSGETTDLNDIFFVDQDHGWAIGNGGVIIRYQPLTGSWTRQMSGVSRSLFNSNFTPSGYGVVVGELGTVLITFNGGI
jgi:photosystem II stability/assembly factor-like uncharacterized protein